MWRRVTPGDFFRVECAPEYAPVGGGGQTYFDLTFGGLDKVAFARFLGVSRPKRILTEELTQSIPAAVLTEPTRSADLEFQPRVRNKSTNRYRIANQNRQRVGMERHPAWRGDRGFPAARDDIPNKEDPSMPDLSMLKLIIVRLDDGTYRADYVNGAAPAGCPTELEVLFRPNAEVAADALISLSPGSLSDAGLARLVGRSHAASPSGTPTSPEIEDAREAVTRAAGRPSRGQGFRQSQPEREAIDKWAMQQAEKFLRRKEWSVKDVSRTCSYDLRCKRGRGRLHVEVKGTTSDGRAVVLTPNEVRHARDVFPDVALLVVHGIRLGKGRAGEPVASGGTVDLTMPWEIDAHGTLTATGYSYERR